MKAHPASPLVFGRLLLVAIAVVRGAKAVGRRPIADRHRKPQSRGRSLPLNNEARRRSTSSWSAIAPAAIARASSPKPSSRSTCCSPRSSFPSAISSRVPQRRGENSRRMEGIPALHQRICRCRSSTCRATTICPTTSRRTGTATLGRRYYHFVYRDVLFLAVNSDDPAETNDKANFGGKSSNEQIEYFKKVLKDNPGPLDYRLRPRPSGPRTTSPPTAG